jgi:AcrR family transcriptional regulator
MVDEEGQRRDAVAHRKAVIDAAVELLSENPDAGIEEIADFSGLGRSTVYRHFPSRQALLEATVADVIEGSTDGYRRAIDDHEDMREALYEIGVHSAETALRHRFIYLSGFEVQQLVTRSAGDGDLPVARFLEEAQHRGEIRDDLPVEWLMLQLAALTIALVGDVEGERINPGEAPRILGETFSAMVGTRS